MSMFIPLVFLAEISGLTGIALMVTWMTKYLGGFSWDGSAKEFNVHPLLMPIGMLFFNGNALLLYRITSGLNLPRIIVKFGHLGLQLLAIVVAIIALFAVFGFHNASGIANMYSFHSWLGMSTFLMFGLQFVFGATFFLVFYFLLPRSESLRGRYLPIHVFFGKIILVMATITTCVGIQEKCQFSMPNYPDIPPQAIVAHLAGASFIIFTSTVLYILSNDSYKGQVVPPAGYQRHVNAE